MKMELLGAICGLSASLCWAVASVFYTRVPIGAGAMTTIKNCVAALIIGALLLVHRLWKSEPIFQANAVSWWWLSWSGVVGLAVCDIAYFRSIQILGARRGLTLTLLTAPMTAVFGFAILGEVLSVRQWIAILVTLSGIGFVMRERLSKTPEQKIRPGAESWGVACAAIAIIGTAYSSVIMKRGSVGIDTLEATFIRLASAGVVGIILSILLRQIREMVQLTEDRQAMMRLAFATVTGTVLGVWFMLTAFKYSDAGVAATLTSTTPLFVIPVVYFVLGQRVTLRSCIGASIAVFGVIALVSAR